MLRELVSIDEALCDGCGLCVPACHEGALRIIDGKARLVSDVLCDGLGACLGECPRGAIQIERREAAEFDETAVAAQRTRNPVRPSTQPLSVASSPAPPAHAGRCPGSRYAHFGTPAPQPSRNADAAPDGPANPPSALTHWPVQLRLLAPSAPVLHGARLLIAADCVPVAYAGFHQKLLHGRAVVLGCPKFDDLPDYVARLAEMIRTNRLAEIVVARMEVPCCAGLLAAAKTARQQAGVSVKLSEIIVSVRGDVVTEREIPP
jgi:NAD-dependent dihydropyrimidine dehydrogenase PreA subunit